MMFAKLKLVQQLNILILSMIDVYLVLKTVQVVKIDLNVLLVQVIDTFLRMVGVLINALLILTLLVYLSIIIHQRMLVYNVQILTAITVKQKTNVNDVKLAIK